MPLFFSCGLMKEADIKIRIAKSDIKDFITLPFRKLMQKLIKTYGSKLGIKGKSVK
jgi:hypothetical protein